ncbi:MAG: FtsX-like permease family protein [Cyclobacteriaceae bacterium]
MIRNFLKTAIRSILKYKVYSTLNVIGLSLGIACAIVIFLQVSYDLSYDDFHPNGDRIYRLNMTTQHENLTEYDPGTPFPVAKTIRQEYPELEKVALIVHFGGLDIHLPGNETSAYEQEHIIFTEPDALEMLQVEWLAGNPDEVLNSPSDAILSMSAAIKLFGDVSLDQIMGREFSLAGETLQVVGLAEDPPKNTVIPWEVFVSTDLQKTLNPFYTPDDFSNVMSEAQTFVLIPEEFNVSMWQDQLVGFTEKYLTENGEKDIELTVQPLHDIHFDERYDAFDGKPVTKQSLWARSTVALLIMIIACVNFINLATAQSVNRAKEVGVRKVMGSSRSSLMAQFLAETFVIVAISVLLSLVLAELMIINFGAIIEFPASLSVLNSPALIPFLGILLVILTLMGGFYPAVIMTRFKPINAMKGNSKVGVSGKASFRNGLVVFQFAITQIMIIGTIVTIQQMEFFQSKPLGFQRDSILKVSFQDADSAQLALIDQLWSKHPFVESVALGSASPTGNLNIESRFGYPSTAKERKYQAQIRVIDDDYLDTYGLNLIGGDDLLYGSENNDILINEATARLIGHDDPIDAIGDKIFAFGDVRNIRGLIADFHTQSLHQPVEPVVLVNINMFIYSAGIRLTSPELVYDKNVIAALEENWRTVFPANVFDFEVLQEFLAKGYEEEQQTADLLKILAIIAIVIGCLGLYGLIAFIANKKVKEIGVRKVLGASIGQVIWLFSSQFIKLIVMAFAIAVPLAIYLTGNWLDSFPYKIDLSPGVFIITLFGTLIIGMGAIVFRAWSAAMVNPAVSLKDE